MPIMEVLLQPCIAFLVGQVIDKCGFWLKLASLFLGSWKGLLLDAIEEIIRPELDLVRLQVLLYMFLILMSRLLLSVFLDKRVLWCLSLFSGPVHGRLQVDCLILISPRKHRIWLSIEILLRLCVDHLGHLALMFRNITQDFGGSICHIVRIKNKSLWKFLLSYLLG